MKEKRWSDFIHTLSLIHLIFMFNKQGLGRIPRKVNSFKFQPSSEKFGTSFSQSSVVVQVDYIPPAKILISLKESKTTLYRLWDSQSWFRQTSTPTPTPPKKSLRICMNLMGGPGRGWWGARPLAPPRGYATGFYSYSATLLFDSVLMLLIQLLLHCTVFV